MNFYIKNIKRFFILFTISLLFVSSPPISATECGILQLQSNRSSGINIKKNDCSKLPDISSGSLFDLSSKGRLWLKSGTTKDNDSNFQLICQNRTTETIQLDFSGIQSPWLNQSKLNNCSGWANNKLICDGNNGEKKGLYCALSLSKSSHNKSQKVERTTSVKMRSLNALIASKDATKAIDKDQILAEINLDLKLCKDLNQQSQKTKISWNVEQNANNHNIDITSSTGLQNASLSECVKTVISTYTYPQLSKKSTFMSTF